MIIFNRYAVDGKIQCGVVNGECWSHYHGKNYFIINK